MRGPVIIGSAFVAQYASGGGNFWVPLQYLLGLRALGVDAYWLELLWTRGDAARDRDCIATFRRHVEAFGVGDRVMLLFSPESSRDQPLAPVEYLGVTEAELAARQRDALLLNLAHSVTPPLRTGFARTALFDLDPGPFQIWAREWDMGVGRHDVHLTIGQNLGAPDSPVPLAGIPWQRVWPAVHLPAWPVQTGGAERHTTVTQWWSQENAFLDGDTFDCHKRSGFIEVIEVP